MSATADGTPDDHPAACDEPIARLQAIRETGGQMDLRRELEALTERFPLSSDASLLAFRIALDMGWWDAAADVLCGSLWMSLPDAGTRRRCLDELLASSGTPEVTNGLLRRLLDAEITDADILVRLATIAMEIGEHGQALAWLERAEGAAPLPREAQALRIEALLHAAEWDDLFGRTLQAALIAAPEVRQLHVLSHDFHEKRGDRARARAALAAARERFPEDPWFAVRAFRLLLAEGNVQEAAALFGDEIWSSSLPEATRRGALASLARQWKALDALKFFLEGLLQDIADDRFILVKLASLMTRQRQHVEAARYLEKALEHGPLPAEAQSMQVNMLILAGDARASLDLAKQQSAANPDRKDLVRRANIVASISGSQDDVAATMRQAITQWPTDASILQRYNRAVIPEAEDRSLFDHLAGFTRANSVDGRWHYQFALACLRRNDTPRARTTLRGLRDDPLVGFEAQRLMSVLDAMPAEAWDRRARFSNDPTKDVQIVETAAAKATVVVMAGLHGGLGNIPLTHLDVLLQQHPINVVYLRDTRWSAFTAGVPSLGHDEASTIAALTALCARLGPVPMITFGGSLGGWSAMRYGALAGAQMAVSLSGPSRLTVPGQQAKHFTQYYLSRLVPESTTDLLDLLGRSTSLRVLHAYGAANTKDSANADRLAQLAQVTLVPVEGCEDHFVAAHLVARGAFHPLIVQAIEAAQVPDQV